MEFLILFLLILVNGLFSMSEMAIVSSRRARLQHRIDGGSRGAAAALRLADDPGVFLSTVQVGITTIGILSGAFGENAIAERLIEVFAGVPPLAPYAVPLATAIMVLVITYFSVVLGELVPKRLALLNPETVASAVAPAMALLARVMHPLVALFSLSSSALLWLLGDKRRDEPPVTEEEIKVMLQQGTAAGVFEKAEETLVGNVFRLDDLRVSALMTPRTELRVIDLDDPPEVNRQLLVAGRFHTMPVCRGGLDDLVGLLDTKDYLARLLGDPAAPIEAAVHAAVFVPESVSAIQLMEALRRHNSHVALVVDEYGGVEGMVTMTDVLRAIVGHLPGRPAGADEEAVQRHDGSWLLDGRLAIDRVEQVLATRLAIDADARLAFHTLGGLVMHQLGRLPATGDRFELGDVHFEVVDMDGNRVDRVLVERPRCGDAP